MKKLIKLGLICIVSTFASGCVQNLSYQNSSIVNPLVSGLQTNDTEMTSEPGETIILTLNPDGGFLNDSSELQEIEYKKDETLTLPIPRKAAFSFDGWFDGDTRVTDNQGKIMDSWSPSSSVTLVAKYVATKNVTLAFHYEGKEVKTIPFSLDSNLEEAFRTSLDIQDPYYGWYKDSRMTEFVQSVKDLSLDINNTAKLYAKKAEGFTIA